MSKDTVRGAFRLLVSSDSSLPSERPSIELAGRRWVLTEVSGARPEDGLEYTCVSYSWGPKRVSNPIDERESMSDRTIAAAEAAIRIEKPEALWVDAFCMPFEEPARSVCLSRMGMIYGRASKVVVVLSALCAGLLKQVAEEGKVDKASLLTLEQDDWVTRVWTYQELVNCSNIQFVAQEGSDVSVGAEEVLNHVGYAIHKYKKAKGYDAFTMRSLHPRLDRLEDLILDWKLSGYLERTAYRVMCGVAGRDSTRPEDQFYAMVGALGAPPEGGRADPAAHPAEYFMRVCEAKGDYSFIYTTATRSEASGKGWRPAAAERFEPVFSWTTYGDGQSGSIHPTHLELNGMWCPSPGSVKPTARQFVAEWLQNENGDSCTETMPTGILRRLKQAGFSGCGEHFELESGFFFPYSSAPRSKEVLVAVSTGLRMPHGALALALAPDRSGLHSFRAVGIFVGLVAEAGKTIKVG